MNQEDKPRNDVEGSIETKESEKALSSVTRQDKISTTIGIASIFSIWILLGIVFFTTTEELTIMIIGVLLFTWWIPMLMFMNERDLKKLKGA